MSTINRLGIDLSADHFDLYLLGSDGQPLAPPKRFHHSQPGSRAAIDFVLRVCQAYPAEQPLLGAEASAYSATKPFGDTFGKTSLDILRQYPTLDALASMPLAELAEQIDVLDKHRFVDPLDNARRLQEVARCSYPLDPAVVQAVPFALGQASP